MAVFLLSLQQPLLKESLFFLPHLLLIRPANLAMRSFSSPSPLLHISICLFLLLIFASPFVSPLTAPNDVNALISLHTAWSSTPSSWDTSTDPCDDLWLGIRCDNTSTTVTELILINQDLNGVLPAAIGDLSNLTDLDLSSNPGLGGSLPKEIGKLRKLKKLFMQFCNYSGSIPDDIGNMTSLEYLGLTRNLLTGKIPATIGHIKGMNWLDLSSNNLTGNLPDSASSGSGLDNLTNAQHFHFQNNSLSGTIPSSIFKPQMRLIHLLLHNNSFTGNIPQSIGNLSSIEILRMDFNNLSGRIPPNINQLPNLTTLQLNNNALTGELPNLSSNTKLQMLELGHNLFNSTAFPTWIANLTNLYLLSLQSANLTGSIPAEVFALPKISNVTIGSNQLSGTLNLTKSNSTLLLVDVTNNSISSLDKGNYTQELLLSGNPYCNNNVTICTNGQSGTSPALPPIASTGSDCTNTCSSEFAINPNTLNCQCARPVVGNITFVATKIPLLTDYNMPLMVQQFLDNLNTNVVNLNLVESQIVVSIVSSNQLTIAVFPPNNSVLWNPNTAASISYVIKNQDFQFHDIGPLTCAFMGTPYTTQVVLVSSLSTGAKIGIAIGVVAFLIVIVMLAAYAVKQKKRAERAEKKTKPFAAWIAASEGEHSAYIPQLKGARLFALAEIRKCTNNFSQINEVGEGSYGKVYKGYLLSGEHVAIKRARANSLQGATEFKNEIELLSRVHHKNLVGLIGFCFEEGEQMLVYEYMPNGTIRECLSGRTGIRLDWERRIEIALASARGIAYLHTEANPPIIHRDIKSSNILLDDKLAAKVADFGLSKLAPDDQDENAPLSTQVKGTLGYLDPDYFMTNRLTDKSDVYSFGVVLLELVTGRNPIQDGKYVVREVRTLIEGGMYGVLQSLVGMYGVLQSLVDPVLTHYPTKGMERLVEVALRCVEDNPVARPTMVELVKELDYLNQLPSSTALEMVANFREDRSELYTDGSPYMAQMPSSSFEYSGSYIDIRSAHPK